MSTLEIKDFPAEIAAADAEYHQQKELVQDLARSGAQREVLREENEKLKLLKRRHGELVKAAGRQVPCTLRRGWGAYPAAMDIPCDDYVTSFTVEEAEASQAWMEKYGFVVFREVLSPEECARSRAEIWDYLEKVPGFRRDRPATWHSLSATETGRYYDAYGLPPDPVICTPQMLRNRQNCRAVQALKLMLGDDDILVSHDRWCFYRSAEHGGVPTRPNLHLDLHPWRYLDGETLIDELRYEDGHDHEFSLEIPRARAQDGPHLQGVLNFLDNLPEDGGTQLVPGFHRVFEKWQLELGHESDWLFKPGQQSNWLHPGSGGASFKFHEKDPIHTLARRIPLREGSLLLWDQRCVHGSCPNHSSRVRMAQFLRGFRRAPLPRARELARARAVQRKVLAAGLAQEVTQLGMEVFGLDQLDEQKLGLGGWGWGRDPEPEGQA